MSRAAAALDRLVAGAVSPSSSPVVSGFWRSGTTWLQEALADLLDAKTVFEPLHVSVEAARPVHVHHGVAERPEPVRELFLPYAREGALPAPLHDAFAAALRGAVPGSEVRVLRQGIGESLRRRVVVKCVRIPLCLRAVQAVFGMPVVHVRRDPRAVVASVRLTDWAWLFDHLSLREQLLDPADGRAALFEPWREEIERLDREEPLERIAAYWALTERALADAYPPGAESLGPTVFARYEDLCRAPETAVPALLPRLGLPPATAPLRAADSHTTSGTRKGATAEQRVDGWKDVLTPEEARRVERVVERFGFGETP